MPTAPYARMKGCARMMKSCSQQSWQDTLKVSKGFAKQAWVHTAPCARMKDRARMMKNMQPAGLA